MAVYPNMVITEAGQALYGKVQTGTTLTFTRFQIGSGQLATSATLSAALVSGTAYTSLSVDALTEAIANGSTIVIGTGGTTQTVTTSAEAAIGATSISVTSFTANSAYASGTSLAITENTQSLTALITPIDYFNINSIADSSGTATIRGIYQNTNLTASTYTCEIGLFAQDPTAGEILYGYANAGSNGDTIPPYADGPFSRQYTISATVGNATSVTANVPSNAYVTASEVGSAGGVASLDPKGQVPASQLGNVPPLPTDLAKTDVAQTFTAKQTFSAGVGMASSDVTSALGYTPLNSTAQAADSAKLGGQPASNYLRTDSGAPNPQTIQTKVIFRGPNPIVPASGDGQGIEAKSENVDIWAITRSGNDTLITTYGVLRTSGAASVASNMTAKSFSGDGTNVTNVNAAELQGHPASYFATATQANTTARGFYHLTKGILNISSGSSIVIAKIPSGAAMFYATDITWYNAQLGHNPPSGWNQDYLYYDTIRGNGVLYDGSYEAGGYFNMNNSYLYFTTNSSASPSTKAFSTILWAVV